MTENKWITPREGRLALLLAGALLLAAALWAWPGLGTAGAAPSVSASLSYGAPGTLSYQGWVHVDGSPFDGTGQFKFAIVDAAGTQMYWANDGSAGAVMEPGAAVSVPVEDGLFNVLLGDTSLSNMDAAIPPDAFSQPDRALRVWFNDGANGFEMLTPDTPLASVPYAFQADQARVAPNLERIALLKWRDEGLYRVGPDFDSLVDDPRGIAYDGAYIWATHINDDCVSKWEAATGDYIDCYGTGASPQDIAFDGRYIWVTNYNDNTVSVIWARVGTTIATVSVGNSPKGIAYTGGAMWVANQDDDTVTVIDPFFNTVGPYPVGDQPDKLAFDGSNMWVTLAGDNAVEVLDMAGDSLATIAVGERPNGIAFDGRHMWVANQQGNSVSMIRASDYTVVKTITDTNIDSPLAVAFDGAYIWVANSGNNRAVLIRAGDGAVVNSLPLGDAPQDLAFDGANMWSANISDNTLSKR